MLSRVQRLPWALTLACLVNAWAATATIIPSNTSTTTTAGQFQGTLPLTKADIDQTHIADVVPLTREAAQRTIEGNLVLTTFKNIANLSDNEIAYISCDPDDYSGYAGPQRVFQDASQANISGVLFYATTANYCNYQQNSSQEMLQSFPVLSMASSKASTALRDQVDNLPVSMKFFVKVQARGDDGNNSSGGGGGGGGANSNSQQTSPLGPSPSTAVAMIILYSITGIITALFLIVIVTGAVRAHRHPERYGPRDVLGRPRQSRARGLGRAILDTIPIVKFGEKDQEPVKPTDVELASTAENGAAGTTATTATITDSNHSNDPTDAEINPVTSANTTTHDHHGATLQGSPAPGPTDPSAKHGLATTTPSNAPTTAQDDYEEGIAPAQPPALAAASMTAAGKDAALNNENLGCSICTEDFEKGQDLRVLPCNHKFHPECVDPWLLNVSGTCPLCRVDLRPVSSNDSSASHDPDDLGLPSNSNDSLDASHRRRTAFRDILSLRTRPNATPEERIHALRRLREQRHHRNEEGAEDSANTDMDDTAAGDRRRSKRMSARLSQALTGRARRDRSPPQQGESSTSGTQ